MSHAGELTSSSSAATSTPIADEVLGKDVESLLCLPEKRPLSPRSLSILEASLAERMILFFKRLEEKNAFC